MPHRTPLKNLLPPTPPFDLRDGRTAVVVLAVQGFTVDRRLGFGALAAERGIEPELDEYFDQVGYVLRNLADLLGAGRAAGWRVRKPWIS